MYEIYTPKQWHSIFKTESLTITDEGEIYEGFKKFGSVPIGKVDWKYGFIYGPDYLDTLGRQPIGKIVEKDGKTIIYGTDYMKTVKDPLFFIKDSVIYTGDQYYKLFPIEAGHIREVNTSNNTTNTSTKKSFGTAAGLLSGGGPFIVGVIVLCIMLWWGATNLYDLLFGGDPENMPTLIAVIVAMIIDVIVVTFMSIGSKKEGESVGATIMGSIVISEILMVLIVDTIGFFESASDPQYASTLKRFLMMYGAGTIVFGFILIIPSIIIGTVIPLIASVTIKRKK